MDNKSFFNGSYKQISAWKKGFRLSIVIYRLTASFPDTEKYGLSSQMQRAAISIPSNIAEGYARGTQKHFEHFLRIAYGSAAELETQVSIAKKLPHLQHADFSESEHSLEEVKKLLYVMLHGKSD